MTTIERVTAEQLSTILEALTVLLQDAVDSGASVGFLPPLSVDVARAYWQGTASDLAQGTRVLLVARHHTQVVGTVQLALATQPNAQHRAEVQKIMVYTQARKQGIGQALMTAIEEAARRVGRTFLVLDTRRGDVSEQLYLKQGYICGGIIPHYARSATGVLDDTAIFLEGALTARRESYDCPSGGGLFTHQVRDLLGDFVLRWPEGKHRYCHG